MGNAFDAFRDITQDGDNFEARLTKSAFSAAEDVLGNSKYEFQFPKLFVAPAATEKLFPRDSRASVAAKEAASRQPEPCTNEADGEQQVWPASSSAASQEDVQKPTQVVLQPGGSMEHCHGARKGAHRRAVWTPLDKCPGLRGRTLLTEARLQELHPYLPVATRFATCWKLIYCPGVHGVSLRTFYRQCQTWPGETLLLLEDATGKVFGGFASHTWVIHQKLHFGNPESFVFSFCEDLESRADDAARAEQLSSAQTLQIYPWAGGNHHFMFADSHGFGMGGGKGYAFWIGKDLLIGSSVASKTFGNTSSLSSSEEFVVRRMECWAFDHSMLASSEEQDKQCEQSAQRSTSPEDSPRGDAPEAGGRSRAAALGLHHQTQLRQQAADALRFAAFA